MQSAIFPGVFLPQRKNLSRYIFCYAYNFIIVIIGKQQQKLPKNL